MRHSAIMRITTSRDRLVLEVRAQVVPASMEVNEPGLTRVVGHDLGYIYWSQTTRSLELPRAWDRVSACFHQSGVPFAQRERQYIIAARSLEVPHPTPFVPNMEYAPGTLPEASLAALYTALIELGLEEDPHARVDIRVIDYDRPAGRGDKSLDGRTIMTYTCPFLNQSLLYAAADCVTPCAIVLDAMGVTEADLKPHSFYPHVLATGSLTTAAQMGQVMARLSRPLA